MEQNKMENGITINGVTWATKNIGANSPKEMGRYPSWKVMKVPKITIGAVRNTNTVGPMQWLFTSITKKPPTARVSEGRHCIVVFVVLPNK